MVLLVDSDVKCILATIKRMAGQPTNNAAPEGVDILRSDKDGRIFVINEVLNYYQRKLNVLGFTDAKMLAHHVFNHEKVFEARKALNSLWLWLDLEPIPAHAKVVKKHCSEA